jgi:DNA-binding PadR family transcriptional regulator
MPGRVDPVNEAIVLALLRDGPRSGYDLRREIESRFEGFVSISQGALYYLLRQMGARGWIRGRRTSGRAGPERVLWSLAPPGRRALRTRLVELTEAEDRIYCPFDVVLYLADEVPCETLERAVERRLAEIEERRRRLARLEERFPGRWPFHFYYLREKTRERLDVEERWCLRLRRKIREKVLAERGRWWTSR